MATDTQYTEGVVSTIDDYLKGCVNLNVPDNAIKTILIDNGIASGTDVTTLGQRERDLCRASLYYWCADNPSITGGMEDANGVWKHKQGGTQLSAKDKRDFRRKADELRKKYGVEVTRSTIKIVNMGMIMNRRVYD